MKFEEMWGGDYSNYYESSSTTSNRSKQLKNSRKKHSSFASEELFNLSTSYEKYWDTDRKEYFYSKIDFSDNFDEELEKESFDYEDFDYEEINKSNRKKKSSFESLNEHMKNIEDIENAIKLSTKTSYYQNDVVKKAPIEKATVKAAVKKSSKYEQNEVEVFTPRSEEEIAKICLNISDSLGFF